MNTWIKQITNTFWMLRASKYTYVGPHISDALIIDHPTVKEREICITGGGDGLARSMLGGCYDAITSSWFCKGEDPLLTVTPYIYFIKTLRGNEPLLSIFD